MIVIPSSLVFTHANFTKLRIQLQRQETKTSKRGKKTLTSIGDIAGDVLGRKVDKMERRVGMVVLGKPPLQMLHPVLPSVVAIECSEHPGERLGLRFPVIQQSVVEHAQVPHFSRSSFFPFAIVSLFLGKPRGS